MTNLQDRDRKGWIMTAKVIPGSFRGGQPKLATLAQRRAMPPPIQAKTAVPPPGPPASAFASPPPGPPAPAFAGRPSAVHRQAAAHQVAMQPKMASPTIQPARRGWRLIDQYGFTGGRIREAGPPVPAAATLGPAPLNLNDPTQWPALPTYATESDLPVATESDLPALPPAQQVVLGPALVPQPQSQHIAKIVPYPGIASLLQKGPSDELSRALKKRYGDELGRQMAIEVRLSTPNAIPTEETLRKRAEAKISKRASESASESKSVGSGSLNVKGKTVSNIQHGTGGGFRAGVPARWHVHFDHVKWGTSTNTRINFTSGTRQTILADFVAQRPQPTSVDRPSWDSCYRWMQNNL
jgi:hypothetical protein